MIYYTDGIPVPKGVRACGACDLADITNPHYQSMQDMHVTSSVSIDHTVVG